MGMHGYVFLQLLKCSYNFGIGLGLGLNILGLFPSLVLFAMKFRLENNR